MRTPVTDAPVGAVARGLAPPPSAPSRWTCCCSPATSAAAARAASARGSCPRTIESWDQAPAPAQVGKRLFEGLFQRSFPTSEPRWSTTSRTGATGSSPARRTGSSPARSAHRASGSALPFGAAVWGTSYVVLPAAGLYQPIWEYDRRTLANDLSAHLVYGLSTAAASSCSRREEDGRHDRGPGHARHSPRPRTRCPARGGRRWPTSWSPRSRPPGCAASTGCPATR